MENVGHCKHGAFHLSAGCPQCIAERRADGVTPELEELEDGLNQEGQTLVATDSTDAEQDSALAIRPGADSEAINHHHEAVKLLEYAEKRTIESVEDYKTATDDLAIIARLKKMMEAKRKEYLDPLKQQTDAIRETYEYLMAPVRQADGITREKMLAYTKEQKRIRQEQEEVNRLREEAGQREAALKGGEITEPVQLVDVVPKAPTKATTDLGTAGQRDNWKWKVVDFSQVPDTYKIIDGSQLTAIARKHHDQKPVAGIEFYNEPIMSVRARN